jgi:thiamine biosynthesis lipoprotein ApbE
MPGKSAEMFYLTAKAIRCSQLTQSAFDIRFPAMSSISKFDGSKQVMPYPEASGLGRAKVGYH